VDILKGLDHIANFLNSLDTEGMTANEVRSAIYKECITPTRSKIMLSVFFALDRSGSMNGVKWSNAIESINDYISKLQGEQVEGKVTIVAFDTADTIRLENLVENKSIAYFKPLATDVAQPSGMTPLYDACANVMDRALASGAERAVVVILTDGLENASREYTQEAIKAKVEQVTAKGYEVLFLGANFDVSNYTKGVGLDMTKMYNFNLQSVADTAEMSRGLFASTVAYARSGQAINLNA
jgi:Mg-chelatase subunit ChlD